LITMVEKRILLAIGGNSLIKDGEHLTVEDQYLAICDTTSQISHIAQRGYKAVITHGNGPQVGFILRRSEIANEVAQMHTVPLVSCDADTQGAIGYQIQQALDNDFMAKGFKRKRLPWLPRFLLMGMIPLLKIPPSPLGVFIQPRKWNCS
jgi:carbamate kinase